MNLSRKKGQHNNTKSTAQSLVAVFREKEREEANETVEVVEAATGDRREMNGESKNWRPVDKNTRSSCDGGGVAIGATAGGTLCKFACIESLETETSLSSLDSRTDLALSGLRSRDGVRKASQTRPGPVRREGADESPSRERDTGRRKKGEGSERKSTITSVMTMRE